MKKSNKRRTMKIAAAAIAVCIIAAGSAGTAAYANNVGGIQRTIQIWLDGDKTTGTLNFTGDGTYEITTENEDGEEEVVMEGGGIAIEDDGTERPLTEEELTESAALDATAPEIEWDTENNKAILYYMDQVTDITDKFEDGVCYLTLENGSETIYLTAVWNVGMAYSPDKYCSPDEFTAK
ncbi:hypothetical protein [Eubacterium oxidoreducens]|nr:hypothetical protein [Eubacterium oxidoreducens]